MTLHFALAFAGFATDEIWFEPYMRWLNLICLSALLLLSIPWTFKAGMSAIAAAITGVLAFLGGLALLLVASIPILAAQPDQAAAAAGDWHYDVSAPQWAVEYGLFAAAALLLPLACRLRFTWGLGRIWPAAMVVLAVALAVAADRLLVSP